MIGSGSLFESYRKITADHPPCDEEVQIIEAL